MPDLAPETLHTHLLDRAPRILRFDPDAYFPEWQSAVRRSFKQLLGLMPARVPPNLCILSDTTLPTPHPHRTIRFLFTSEPRVDVPCTLLLPTDTPGPLPTFICLNTTNDFPHHALRHGHASLLIDLRSTGERRSPNPHATPQHPALVALLLGRTMIGEHVCDISRAIDLLTENFPQLDPARISLLGSPEAAAVPYYAAAFDPRIAAVITHGIAAYASSLAATPHPAAHYLPNILHYFDLSDLAGLITPRPLLILATEQDPLYPLPSTQECFTEIHQIYHHQNSPHTCRLLTTPHPPTPQTLWTASQLTPPAHI